MTRAWEFGGGIFLTCTNLAILFTLILVVMPRLDHHAIEEDAQTRQLKLNFQTIQSVRETLDRSRELSEKALEATRENHRLHEQHQIDLKLLTAKLRALTEPRPAPEPP